LYSSILSTHATCAFVGDAAALGAHATLGAAHKLGAAVSAGATAKLGANTFWNLEILAFSK